MSYSWLCFIQTTWLQGYHPSWELNRAGNAFLSLFNDLFQVWSCKAALGAKVPAKKGASSNTRALGLCCHLSPAQKSPVTLRHPLEPTPSTHARYFGRTDLRGGHLLDLNPYFPWFYISQDEKLLRLSSGLSKLRKLVQSEITPRSMLRKSLTHTAIILYYYFIQSSYTSESPSYQL